MLIRFNEAVLLELSQTAVMNAADELAARANTIPSTTAPAATEPYYEVEDQTGREVEVRVQTTVMGRDQGHRAAWHEAKTHALQRGL